MHPHLPDFVGIFVNPPIEGEEKCVHPHLPDFVGIFVLPSRERRVCAPSPSPLRRDLRPPIEGEDRLFTLTLILSRRGRGNRGILSPLAGES